MLFNIISENSKKYGNKPALNNWSWAELPEIIKNRAYLEVCNSSGVDILLDILKASSLNRPITVLPLDGNFLQPNYDKKFLLTLYSSGSTTGVKKPKSLSESVILSNAKNSIAVHNLTNQDCVLTVCTMNHTGGINAQTIPALIAGSHVIISKFNPYKFWEEINLYNVTITHLTPRMIDSLIKFNKWETSMLRLVTCGSDCVKPEHVSCWTKHNIPLLINYGMTEAGPIIINHQFNPGDDLAIFDYGVPLGTQQWCDVKIIDDELWLRGDNVIGGDTWFATDDVVCKRDKWLLYRGRKSADCKIIPKRY